jgi:Chaperone of endosialidase/Collagen triple helix repeat (20 copies)
MKTILLNLIKVGLVMASLSILSAANAQAPQKMSYQAVVRNSNNELLASKTVGMRISILQGSATGTAVYVETQTPTTNANGLASVEIGGGTVVTGTVASINWAAGPYFIKTETDPSGGSNYSIAGVSQLLSVPYALFSASGNPGPVGPIGPQGIAGANGATGAQGVAGPIGPAGPQGIAGSVGASGAVGATGAQGVVGPIGPAGANGTVGATGAQGAAGSIGPAGPQGIQGVAGPAGTVGWGLTGNTGSNPTTNFIGTSDDKDIIIKRNNVRAGLLSSSNTSYGVGALNPLSIGAKNTAIGGTTLAFNTTGSNNTVNGFEALLLNTSGSNNTANGYGALYSNVDGFSNTALGSGALGSNSSGYINIAVGYALVNNTLGNNNIAIGDLALHNNTNGSYNTAIGSGANVSTGALTNATALGTNAIVNASNKVRIGGPAVTVVEVPVAVTVSSDGRLKNNIVDTELGLDFILKIRPVQYTMKQGNGKTDYGFIAQELKTVLGDRNVNMLNKDGEFYTVRYNDLLSPMVKAMQEQQKIIENLKEEVALLKKQQMSATSKLEIENSLLKSDYSIRLKKLEEMLSAKAQK